MKKVKKASKPKDKIPLRKSIAMKGNGGNKFYNGQKK